MVCVYDQVGSSGHDEGSDSNVGNADTGDHDLRGDDQTEVIANSRNAAIPVRLGDGQLPTTQRGFGSGLRFSRTAIPAGSLEGAKLPMPNFGRTCYASAMLQSFSACIQTESDEQQIYRVFKCDHDLYSRSCIQCAVKAVLSDHHSNRRSFLSSLEHLITIQGKDPYNFGVGWDRDPSEYLTHVLIKDITLDYSNPIVGTYRTVTTCLTCGKPKSSLPQSYSYLILPVKASGPMSEIVAASVLPELLRDTVECPFCMPSLLTKTPASSKIIYDTFPKFLFVFFTQYRYNQDALDQILKTDELVHVSETLDFSVFGPAGNGLQGELVSSIVHSSSPDHFTASVKAPGSWVYKMDDSMTPKLLPFDTVNHVPVYGRVFVVSNTGALLSYPNACPS